MLALIFFIVLYHCHLAAALQYLVLGCVGGSSLNTSPSFELARALMLQRCLFRLFLLYISFSLHHDLVFIATCSKERWRLFEHVRALMLESHFQELLLACKDFEKMKNQLEAMYDANSLKWTLRYSRVVGMTTTGVAKKQQLVKALMPKVPFCEFRQLIAEFELISNPHERFLFCCLVLLYCNSTLIAALVPQAAAGVLIEI